MKHKKTTKKVKTDILDDLIKVFEKHQPCPVSLAEMLLKLSMYSALERGNMPLKIYSKLVNETIKEIKNQKGA